MNEYININTPDYLGRHVYVMYKGKPHKGTIHAINIKIFESLQGTITQLEYTIMLMDMKELIKMKDSHVFFSKADVVDHLMKNL